MSEVPVAIPCRTACVTGVGMRRLAAVVAIAAALAHVDLAGQVSSAEQVRDRLDAYLRTYEAELSALVATEVMTQVNDSRFNRTLRIDEPGRRRKLDSEVAFIGLPGNAGLLGFRRVTRVDGRSVEAPGGSLTEWLQTMDPLEAARTLLEQSGRHNLGPSRTTNLPTLPVELLHPRHRRRFAHVVKGRETVRGSATTILIADEIAMPSIVRSPDGSELPSQVTAWVDDAGRLWRAEVRPRLAKTATGYSPALRVEFARHDALDLLVPTEMREEYWDSEDVTRGQSVARYANYRRFQTSARIVPP